MLLVDDEPGIIELLTTYFHPRWRVRAAYNAWQAFDELERIDELALALVDLNLPGSSLEPENLASGFAVIERTRSMFPRAIVCTFTAHVNSWTVNTTARLGAEMLAKDGCHQNLELLVRRLLAISHTAAPIASAVADFSRVHGLTNRETQIIALASRQLDRSETAEQLGISLSTVKTHISNILNKCGVGSMDQIRKQLLRNSQHLRAITVTSQSAPQPA